MQTDNKTMATETLEEAKDRTNPFTYLGHNNSPSYMSYRLGFDNAATWQQAQYIPLIESHLELKNALEEFLKVINRSDAALWHYGNAIKIGETAIEKANKLIQTT